MQRTATIHVWECLDTVIASVQVTTYPDFPELPSTTSTGHVQVPGTGDDDDFRWMKPALEQLIKSY